MVKVSDMETAIFTITRGKSGKDSSLFETVVNKFVSQTITIVISMILTEPLPFEILCQIKLNVT